MEFVTVRGRKVAATNSRNAVGTPLKALYLKKTDFNILTLPLNASMGKMSVHLLGRCGIHGNMLVSAGTCPPASGVLGCQSITAHVGMDGRHEGSPGATPKLTEGGEKTLTALNKIQNISDPEGNLPKCSFSYMTLIHLRTNK